jgi:hypothetical protein
VDLFFGEPALDLQDLLQTDPSGKGMINVLAASRLMSSPALYSTFLLYLLSELFEQLPEVGDPAKPSLVFFDEAHLLFAYAPKPLQEKIEHVVRLIRSKGVGVYFATQNPLDLPETVLGQPGNRVQHALRAFTPKEQKAVKAAADKFRANPKLDVVKAITELGVGEALVSVLDPKGSPTVVERAFIFPPKSRLTHLSPEERSRVVGASVLRGHYDRIVDRESAYEKLKEKAAQRAAAEAAAGGAPERGQAAGKPSQTGVLLGAIGQERGARHRRPPARPADHPGRAGVHPRRARQVTGDRDPGPVDDSPRGGSQTKLATYLIPPVIKRLGGGTV